MVVQSKSSCFVLFRSEREKKAPFHWLVYFHKVLHCISLLCTITFFARREIPGYDKKMTWVGCLPLRRCTAIFLLLAIYSSGLLKGVVVAAFTTASPATKSVKAPRCFQKALCASFSTIENDNHESDQEQIMRNRSRQSQTQAAASQSSRKQEELFAIDRRTTLLATAALLLPFATVMAPSPALALKPKNEALCGTGFFEHIYEYKCTAIGDIEDEGTSRVMSKDENGLTDSLMGKLGFDNNDDASQPQQQSSSLTDKKSETTKPKKENPSGA